MLTDTDTKLVTLLTNTNLK